MKRINKTMINTLVFNACLIDCDLTDFLCDECESVQIIGFIQSVYTNVINIYVNKLNDTEFFSIATNQAIPSPNMIMIDGMADFRNACLNIKPYNPIEISNGTLSLSDDVHVDLRTTIHWCKNIHSIPPIKKDEIFRAYDVLNRYIQRVGKEGGFKNPWIDFSQTKLKSSKTLHEIALHHQLILLNQASVEGNNDKVLELLKPLIGLGVGLTPSGDDFIVGFVFTLQALSHPFAQFLFFNRNGFMKLARYQTTIVSYYMLKHAFEGKANEALIDLLSSIGHSSSLQSILSYCDRLLTMGSCSGTDMLAGVLFALRFKSK